MADFRLVEVDLKEKMIIAGASTEEISVNLARGVNLSRDVVTVIHPSMV